MMVMACPRVMAVGIGEKVEARKAGVTCFSYAHLVVNQDFETSSKGAKPIYLSCVKDKVSLGALRKDTDYSKKWTGRRTY